MPPDPRDAVIARLLDGYRPYVTDDRDREPIWLGQRLGHDAEADMTDAEAEIIRAHRERSDG